MDLEEVMGIQELQDKKGKFKILLTYAGGIAGQSVIKMINNSTTILTMILILRKIKNLMTFLRNQR